MDQPLQRETERLTQSWMQHDSEMLRTYLVSGVEDPRINVQSILARHFLIVGLQGTAFHELLEQELRFALIMNWAQSVFQETSGPEDCQVLRHALRAGHDNAEGFSIPHFVARTFASLPVSRHGVIVPNYLDELLSAGSEDLLESPLFEETLSTFQNVWSQVLRPIAPSGRSVLEVACGSANDYRFLAAFGVARLLDYTGMDLCQKNIANARAMFPEARFELGNALAIAAPDQSFDYCLVQDLFEHLSLEALIKALDEVCRVTSRSLCLGFFNLDERGEHTVRPMDNYHWNTLSVPRLRQMLDDRGFDAQVVHIDTFCKWRFGCDQTHNKNGYTFFAERRAP